MRDISRQSVERRLAQDNLWWASPELPPRYEELPRRTYFERFLDLVQLKLPRRAVVLMGPRRVGKTVLLHQAIGALIKSGINPKSIAYINLEVPLFNGLGLEEPGRLRDVGQSARIGEWRFVRTDPIVGWTERR